MTIATTRLTLSDINRTEIAEATVMMADPTATQSPKHPRFVGSLHKAAQIAAYLGITLDEFWAFLRLECGKDI